MAELREGEIALWTGESARRPPQRWAFALNAVAAVAVLLLVEVLLGKSQALPYTALVAVVGLAVSTPPKT